MVLQVDPGVRIAGGKCVHVSETKLARTIAPIGEVFFALHDRKC
jgi:hypothetical protein